VWSKTTPLFIDWRQRGAVTPVKDQGSCGACWAFSTTGNIEGQWTLAGHDLVSLSEQYLVSCAMTCGECLGCWAPIAFDWLLASNSGGIPSEELFPYNASAGWPATVPCNMTGKRNVAWISGHVRIASDEAEMAAWVGINGPLSVAVNSESWQSYTGGVLSDCTNGTMDHVVLVVGYDLLHTPPYWIIKNSWGPSWGEGGYIRLIYGCNQCNIAGMPTSAVANTNGPYPQPPNPAPPVPPITLYTMSSCVNAMCWGGECSSQTLHTGYCFKEERVRGGSNKSSCQVGGENLTVHYYSSDDCSGHSTSVVNIPLDACEPQPDGSFQTVECST